MRQNPIARVTNFVFIFPPGFWRIVKLDLRPSLIPPRPSRNWPLRTKAYPAHSYVDQGNCVEEQESSQTAGKQKGGLALSKTLTSKRSFGMRWSRCRPITPHSFLRQSETAVAIQKTA